MECGYWGGSPWGWGRDVLHTHILHLQIYFRKQLDTSLCLGVAWSHPFTAHLLNLRSVHLSWKDWLGIFGKLQLGAFFQFSGSWVGGKLGVGILF